MKMLSNLGTIKEKTNVMTFFIFFYFKERFLFFHVLPSALASLLAGE